MTIVLLGAGASVDAGLPTSRQLTDRMLDYFRLVSDSRGEPLEPLLRFIRLTSDAHLAAARSEVEGVDIERLFTIVRLLKDRGNHPLAPFVERWRDGLASAAHLRRAEEYDVDRVLREIKQQSPNAGRELIRLIEDVTGSPAQDWTLHEVEEYMLLGLPGLLTPPLDSSAEYLRPLLTLAGPPQTIVTLNYDLVIETLAADHGLVVDRGVRQWDVEPQFDPAADVHLLKLHGSLDWAVAYKSFQEVHLEVVEHLDHRHTPAVVFGEGNKLQADGPFLPLFIEFSRRLETTDRLLIVGYSFRDDHVNAVLRRWMNTSDRRRAYVVTPNYLDIDGFSNQHPVFTFDVIRGSRRLKTICCTAADGIELALQRIFAEEDS